jgi:hypothetical protein
LVPDEDDEKIIREVMKMSQFEYQKETVGIDLSKLKKKKNDRPDSKQKDQVIHDNINDRELERLMRIFKEERPHDRTKDLPPVRGFEDKGKNMFSNNITHQESNFTIDASQRTQDQTVTSK